MKIHRVLVDKQCGLKIAYTAKAKAARGARFRHRSWPSCRHVPLAFMYGSAGSIQLWLLCMVFESHRLRAVMPYALPTG